MSSDGLLRLDLDLEDAVVNIGSQNTTADGAKTPKETNRSPMESLEEEPEAEADVSPQKKVIKPPMPPNKAAKPTPTPAKEGGVDDFNEVCTKNKTSLSPVLKTEQILNLFVCLFYVPTATCGPVERNQALTCSRGPKRGQS